MSPEFQASVDQSKTKSSVFAYLPSFPCVGFYDVFLSIGLRYSVDTYTDIYLLAESHLKWA